MQVHVSPFIFLNAQNIMHKTWFPEQPHKHYEKFLRNLILTFWYWFGCVEMFASRASSENTEHLTFWSLIPRIWESLKKKADLKM